MPTARRLADVNAAAHDPWGLVLGSERVIAVGSPAIPQRGMSQQVTTPSRGAPPCPPPAVQAVECRCAHQTTPPSQEPIVVGGRRIAAIGLGQPRPNDGAEVTPWMPVLVRARHATHRQPKDQPDMVHADFRPPARQAPACPQALAAVALIRINAAAAVSRPPQATARAPTASGLAVDALCSTPCRGWDGRTDTIATRGR